MSYGAKRRVMSRTIMIMTQNRILSITFVIPTLNPLADIQEETNSTKKKNLERKPQESKIADTEC